MLKKKQAKNVDIDIKQSVCSSELEPYKQPMVFLFDVEYTVFETLKKLRFNSFNGSFGSIVKVNNKKHEKKFLKLNYDYPANLHEFDIVMLDMTKNKTENYDPSQHELVNTSGNTAHALLSTYPEQVFDPRPLAIKIVSKDLNDLCEKKSVIIAFLGAIHISEFQFVEITNHGETVTSRENMSNSGFYQSFPAYKSRNGRKVKLPENDSMLSPLFQKHLDNINFETTFIHPLIWREGKSQRSEHFIPILLNERDEIVSYAHYVEKSIIFVFPDIADKPSFVSELFKTYLPDLIPEIFPYHGEFKWLHDGNYPLPGERQLLRERAELEEKYTKDVALNEKALASLKISYKFLSDLISETGVALVSAVEAYLKWLEFESVVNLDETNPDLLEEDIQIDCNDRFLVIEIKGIGGTSTDKDCSQISKIKYRRAEERNKFDVFGLYIVNHQRYMPPKSRSNPPFTANQIKDAGHDKRGLLTTYELYKAYYLIEEGIMQKADVRESLFKTGLINFEPKNMLFIGTPDEIFLDGQVAILNLKGTNLAVGDTLVVRRNGDYSKAIIQSMQVDGNEVDNCTTGEIGIKLDRKLKKNSDLFLMIT